MVARFNQDGEFYRVEMHIPTQELPDLFDWLDLHAIWWRPSAATQSRKWFRNHMCRTLQAPINNPTYGIPRRIFLIIESRDAAMLTKLSWQIEEMRKIDIDKDLVSRLEREEYV